MLYVIENTTGQLVEAPQTTSDELRKIHLRHARTKDKLRSAMAEPYCRYPLAITRWGEHNGELWHKASKLFEC
jgi:hypothetical protein